VAEILLGDILARLRVDASQFTQAMQDAQQRLQQLTQALAQIRTQSTSTQQATQQVAQAFQTLNQSVQQQTQAYTQAQGATQQYRQAQLQLLEAIRQQRQEQEQATQATQAQGTALRTVLSVAGGIGLATSLGAIVGQMKELATSIVAVGVQFQQLRQQFTATQGVAAGAANFQQMIGLAQRLGVELVPLAEGFRRFDAATRGTAIQGEQAARIFENIVVGMRAMGATSEQTTRGLLAIQQIVSKGVVSQEELRQQLAEALPGAVQIAARAFGVTTDVLNKMIEKGQDGIEFVRRLGEQMRTELAGTAAIAVDNIATAFQRLANEIKLAGETIAASGLLETLRTMAESATTLLATLRKAQEERSREAGPSVGALPQGGAGFPPAIRERQAALVRLQEQITGAQAAQLTESMLPGFAGPITSEERRVIREKIQVLDAEQRKALAEYQRKLQAEGFGPGGQVGFGVEIPAAERPIQALEDRLAKILDQGRQQLRDIDLNAPFLSELDLADQKFKSWEKTLKAVQEELGKVGEGIRRTITPSRAPTAIDALIEQIAGEKGLDPNLMRALVEQESGFDPRVVSRAGARGLMQLMPGTAAAYGAGGREFEPEANLRAGMSYFAELLQKFNGNVERALTAYNAGPARGGIPLPTGENATFAQDVLRRMPQGVQGLLDAAARTGRSLEAGQEAQTPDTERLQQTRATGRAYLQALDEEERQRDVDARERRQQAMATGREYLRGLDEEVQKRFQAVESLKRLEQQYSLTADARKEGDAARLAAQFPQDEEIQTRAENVRLLIEEKQAMESSFATIKARTDAQREAQATAEGLTQSIEGTLERLQAPREERAEIRLRAQARRQGVTLTPDDEARLKAITQQERLNDLLQTAGRLGDTVADQLTRGLLSIADHTQTVSEAFAAMAKSILASIAEITLNEGFKTLIRLGITAIGAAITGGAGTGVSSLTGVPAGTTYIQAQGGAVINRPTMLMAGENSLMNPEYVLNRPQMQALMQSGPSAGGQAMGGVVVINIADRAEGERRAAQERALGRSVVVNYVLDELAQGSGSRIGQVLRAGQR
jgi:tape measure domain-containing protein